MATHGRIILLVFVVLLAGCGQDNTVAATRATVKEAPTTTGATTTLAPTTSAAAPTTTVTMAPTTTTTATTTTSTVPDTTTTTIPHADQILPGSFGTMGELYSRTNPDRLYPLIGQVVSSIGFASNENDQPTQDPPEWGWAAMTITQSERLTLWDYGTGYREVVRPGSPYLYLAEDGTWHEIDDEGSIFSPITEWRDAQGLAARCIELGAETVGLEEVIGVTTLHIRCPVDGGDRGGAGSLDVWIDERGYVMKGAYEFWEEPEFGVGLRWEVTGLDVEPSGPLPPGW
ncbi:MAG: hypothetical protein WBN24_05630 [Acidimicrobiia bacterium]